MSKPVIDPMTPEELQACRERAEDLCATDPETIEPDNFAEALHVFMDHVVADVPRLLATVAARDEEIDVAHRALDAIDIDGGRGTATLGERVSLLATVLAGQREEIAALQDQVGRLSESAAMARRKGQ